MGQNGICVGDPPTLIEHLSLDLVGRRAFRAMNTDVLLTLQDWSFSHHLGAVEQFFHDFERRFSRFIPDSELSSLNASSGHAQRVSHQMLLLLIEARRLHDLTGGVFDPTILTALETAGYDRSFDDVERYSEKPPGPGQLPAHSFADVMIDEPSRTATIPIGVRVDLGGIGKGFAIDRAAEMLKSAGPSLISAGGDLYGTGDGPYGDGWLIAVTNPEGREVDRVVLHDEAVATSTVALRTWQRGGRTMHHLIDPASGRPANNGTASVTVVARTATDADVFAKTALILGLDEGREFLFRHDAQALFVLNQGDVIATDRWPGKPGR